MEFFRIINKQISEQEIQNKITPNTLETLTDMMFLINDESNFFVGGTLWGTFNISYHKINGGVRFTLLNCPNALAWTITTGFPPERNKIVLHCTINRTQKPKEFVDEINDFLNDWENGLIKHF
ncbi:MAG: hypothetical protein ACWA42_06910 [Lutibacter sp.]